MERFERAWGGSELVRPVVYKAFMLVGKVRTWNLFRFWLLSWCGLGENNAMDLTQTF